MKLTNRKKEILGFILQQSPVGIAEIMKQLGNPAVSTINRDLKALVEDHLLIKSGKGREGRYFHHRRVGSTE